MLKFLYTAAIGLLFAGFVGFGVATFYKGPTPPQVPVGPIEDKTVDLQFQRAEKDYQAANDIYYRNLSIIFLAASVIVVSASLFGLGNILVIGDGITLGGVILLFAGIITTFQGNNAIYRFLAVTVGLAIVITLTYVRFIRPHQASVGT